MSSPSLPRGRQPFIPPRPTQPGTVPPQALAVASWAPKALEPIAAELPYWSFTPFAPFRTRFVFGLHRRIEHSIDPFEQGDPLLDLVQVLGAITAKRFGSELLALLPQVLPPVHQVFHA